MDTLITFLENQNILFGHHFSQLTPTLTENNKGRWKPHQKTPLLAKIKEERRKAHFWYKSSNKKVTWYSLTPCHS